MSNTTISVTGEFVIDSEHDIYVEITADVEVSPSGAVEGVEITTKEGEFFFYHQWTEGGRDLWERLNLDGCPHLRADFIKHARMFNDPDDWQKYADESGLEFEDDGPTNSSCDLGVR